MKKAKADGPSAKTLSVYNRGVGLIILSACFLCGAVAGCLTAFHANGEAGSALQSALRDIPLSAEGSPLSGDLFWGALLGVFKFPLAVFLLGLMLPGAFGIPVVMAVRGFSLSFAVSSFVRAFGSSGLLLALGALGIQSLLTLPCLFRLAEAGLQSSISLMGAVRGRLKIPLSYTLSAAYFLRFALLAIVLTGTALFEALAVPPIFRLIADRIVM